MKDQGGFLGRQVQTLTQARQHRLDQAERLQADLAELSDDQGPGDYEVEDGFGEGAGAAVEQDRDRALRARALAAVEEIDAALDRIAAGGYGQCMTCGDQIAEPRLEAVPTTTTCMVCATGGLSRLGRGHPDRSRLAA